MSARRPPASRHRGDPSVLAAALDASSAELVAGATAADAAAGLVPPWARRPVNLAESAARVSFLALDDGVERAVAEIMATLTTARVNFSNALYAALVGRQSGQSAVLLLQTAEVTGLGIIAGVRELMGTVTALVRDVLVRTGAEAAAGALVEALAQGYEGVMPAYAPSIAGDLQVEQLARRLTTAPMLDALTAAREAVVAAPTPAAAVDVARLAADTVVGLSSSPLEAYARQAAAQAQGLGRQAAALAVRPRAIYASEILDRNTCGPCSLVDEKLYPTLEAARVDYPNGTYRACDGGLRCRGTLVFVWRAESLPTLAVPGDRPLPGAGGPGGPPLPRP